MLQEHESPGAVVVREGTERFGPHRHLRVQFERPIEQGMCRGHVLETSIAQ
jgi:hypothetical protein